MATVDTSYVRRELKAIIATSKVVAKQIHNALEVLESSPGKFPKLDDIPSELAREYPGATFRKIKIQHSRHSFRLIFIHWMFEGGGEHVDVIYAFRRQEGYAIDWEWIESILSESNE